MIHRLAPEIKPFERLRVSDGLLINAERWQREHLYHRDRQNVHYQATNHAGVVWGLGVWAISAPEDVPEQYWDGRWVQIQPGLAIDAQGNPIVIPEPMNFRIASTAIAGQSITVYLVVRYVDPEQLQGQTTLDIVRETFRIDEKNSPPTAMEVELCRVIIQTDIEKIQPANQVLLPTPNQLDLRFRVAAQARPLALIKVATWGASPQLNDNWVCLLQSTPGLYPALQAAEEVQSIQLQSFEELALYDLLVMPDAQARSLSEAQLNILHQFQLNGGVVLVEFMMQGTRLEELLNVQQQLNQELARFSHQDLPNLQSSNHELAILYQSLVTEQNSIQLSLKYEIEAITRTFQPMTPEISDAFESWSQLPRRHPLRTQPFLFASLPVIQQQSTQLLTQGSMILLLGNVSTVWQGDEANSLSRETIRSAQEIGINLLHYAWQRKHLTQLQGVSPLIDS